MENLLNCLKCNLEYIYEDGIFLVCLECFYEWVLGLGVEEDLNIIKDVNGNVLNDGDFVIVIRDFKVKGSLLFIKIGIKVKNICLIYDLLDGYDIECKIDGFGVMKLKFFVVKKV